MLMMMMMMMMMMVVVMMIYFNKNERFNVCGAAKAPAVKLQLLDSLTLNNVICNLRLPLRRLMISLYSQRVGSS